MGAPAGCLSSGDEFDQSGCFSGSAVDDHGRLALIYTGHNIIDQEKDLFYQTQNIAVSQDGTVFEKLQENPVIAEPPEDSARHFRDPKVWKHRDVWYMVIGNSSKKTSDGSFYTVHLICVIGNTRGSRPK